MIGKMKGQGRAIYAMMSWLFLAVFLIRTLFLDMIDGRYNYEFGFAALGLLSLLFVCFHWIVAPQLVSIANIKDPSFPKFKTPVLIQEKRIRTKNYIFAFIAMYFTAVISIYIQSLILLQIGAPLYQVINPLSTSEGCFGFLLLGSFSFILLIPSLKNRLLRYYITLSICCFWIGSGILKPAKLK